jgi:hypothetical protein
MCFLLQFVTKQRKKGNFECSSSCCCSFALGKYNFHSGRKNQRYEFPARRVFCSLWGNSFKCGHFECCCKTVWSGKFGSQQGSHASRISRRKQQGGKKEKEKPAKKLKKFCQGPDCVVGRRSCNCKGWICKGFISFMFWISSNMEKAIYTTLFEWLVTRINSTIAPGAKQLPFK